MTGVPNTAPRARHSTVDEVAWRCFDYAYQMRFYRCRGVEFQTFFTEIMSRAHGDAFSPVGTWGSEGDMKCDGYLHTERMVFAVYAPKDFKKLSKAKTKIREDHKGAINHWLAHMDRWTLVHNSDPEIPASLLNLLKQLEAGEPRVKVREWGFQPIRSLISGLTRVQLTELFGKAPDMSDLIQISQEDVKRAVDDLAVVLETSPSGGLANEDLRAVPVEKIKLNKLSNAVSAFLEMGRINSQRVQAYFEGHTDISLADRVVNAFRARYLILKSETKLDPDQLFNELLSFAGRHHTDPRVTLAGLSVVTYLFERCHIFERPAELPASVADAAAH